MKRAIAMACAAALAACSSAQTLQPTTNAARASADGTGAGKLEISKSGGGLIVRLINPPNGAAGSTRSYQKEKANCNGHAAPCYVFGAVDGQVPLPISAQGCSVDKIADAPTAFCDAAGISSVIIEAPTGGTIGYDASGKSELGKNCFPSKLTYEVGPKDVYSVLAWDGCSERIHCEAHNVGTVDADTKDSIEGPCYFVQRH